MYPGQLPEEIMTSTKDAAGHTAPKLSSLSFSEYNVAADIERKQMIDALLDEIKPVSDTAYYRVVRKRAKKIVAKEETSRLLFGNSVTMKCQSFDKTPNERFMLARCRLEDPLPWYSGARHHPYNGVQSSKHIRARSLPSTSKASSKMTSRPRTMSQTSTAPTKYTE
ncbi:hypothetical protein TWF694_003695 [Orbilia ellipsospora]|uniref:Uncharacterized protein n=1 Tax=Orbilia ellipsospora TaxID=2528407 RepID=A0AAV9X1G7_9PEZI